MKHGNICRSVHTFPLYYPHLRLLYTHTINLLKQPVPKYREAFQPVFVWQFQSLPSVVYEPCSNSWYPSAPVKITSTHILMASGLGAIRWYVLSFVFTTNVTWGFGDFTEFRWSTYTSSMDCTEKAHTLIQFCCNIWPQVLSTSYCPINNTFSSQPFCRHTINGTKFWDRQTDQVS